MKKNVLNNSYSVSPYYSNNKFTNIFQPIESNVIKNIRKLKTPKKVYKKQKILIFYLYLIFKSFVKKIKKRIIC